MNQNLLQSSVLAPRADPMQVSLETKKGNLQGRPTIVTRMQTDLDRFLGKGSLVFQQANEKFKQVLTRPTKEALESTQTIKKSDEDSSSTDLKNRTVEIIKNIQSNLDSFLKKGSASFQLGIEKLRKACIKEQEQIQLTKEEILSIKIEPLAPLLPADMAYLHPKDAAYNLKRLSEISIENAIQSVCTEEISKTIPEKTAMILGYDNPDSYRAVLGDHAIVAQVALIALSILGINIGNLFSCRASNQYAKFSHCIQSTAEIWKNTSGKTLLAICGLILGTSLYSHNKGWIGTMLYDRSLLAREKNVANLFREASGELFLLAGKNSTEAIKTAKKILQKIEFIQTTLHVNIGISSLKAKKITDDLKNACQDILSHHFLDTTPEKLLSAKEITA